MHVLIKIAATLATVLWLGIVGRIGTSAAYELKGYWAAVPTTLLMLIASGFMIGAVWMGR